VKTFEAKSLIQHAADSRFWPNPRRRASADRCEGHFHE
jgi:hypothetical protein